jgi:THO complex subunit 5
MNVNICIRKYGNATHKSKSVCLYVRGNYRAINLVSLDEFNRSAPSHLIDSEDEHRLMLNRLEFERIERIRLSDDLSNLKKQKEDLQNKIKEKISLIENMENELLNLAQVSTWHCLKKL